MPASVTKCLGWDGSSSIFLRNAHEGVVHGIDGTAGGRGGDGGEQARLGDAEARFLAFQVVGGQIDAEIGQQRVTVRIPHRR